MRTNQDLWAVVLAAISLGISTLAQAETIDVELGWGNITPCSRAVCNGGWFCPDTIEWADQRVTAYATVVATNLNQIQNDIQQCAVQGAAAAGLAAIISSPVGAMPAFSAQFGNCMISRSSDYLSVQLWLSEGQCMW